MFVLALAAFHLTNHVMIILVRAIFYFNLLLIHCLTFLIALSCFDLKL